MDKKKTKVNKNFTKLTHKGISLIVLIVTIIVIIILAAVIILTINQNNPLNSAKEAVFREDINNFETELEIYKANMKYKDENPEELNANKETIPGIQEVITSMSNKYAKVLEVRNGKLVYIGKDKEGYRLAYKIGILPEDELVDDEIMEELQPFITEWTVEAGDSITLPLVDHSYVKYDFKVNYGDGTGEYKVTSANDCDKTHVYENTGSYQVTITGKCSEFMFSKDSTSKDKITKIVQWGNVFRDSFWNGVDFLNCTNLTGTIPEPSLNTFKSLTSLTNLFKGCEKLQSEIPDKLLYNCSKVKSVANLFAYSSITGEIPENLFAKCPNITSFSSAFEGCTGIVGKIPEGLFMKNVNAIYFEKVFFNCTGLTGSIPRRLFINNTKVKSFYRTFEYCCGLTGNIPEELFVNCQEVENFNGTFAYCTELTGNIPEKLFANCPEVITFERLFCKCENLTGNIPENLFRNNTKVKSFSTTFSDCCGLTGNIPEKLFTNCQEVENFNGTFRFCTNITGIYINLFDNNIKANSFYCTFYHCYKLGGEAPELWKRDNIGDSRFCFASDYKLSNYNDIPDSWKR